MTNHDIALIGGGILGLASARELLMRHPQLRLALLEKDAVLAGQQSGHNSGVIHCGIYYQPGTLKARLCTEGRQLLWRYCDMKGIPYRHVGKLIVATESRELPLLDSLFERGRANGIAGLERLDAAGIREREPYCHGVQAIYSPMTGIIDYAQVAAAFAQDIRSMGGEIRLRHEVTAIERVGRVLRIHTGHGEVCETRHVVACAGLHADRLAKMSGGASDPKIVPFRGDYLVLNPEKRHWVHGNIYPVPDPDFPFLGVHFTPRMNGEIWLGPNAVLAFAREGYRLSRIAPRDLFETLSYPGFLKLASKHFATGMGELYRDVFRHAFVRRLQRYIPELQVQDTLPGPSGVRAQAMCRDGSMVDDFVFEGQGNCLHVRNAPSPAATSSLAIARHIADEAARRFGLNRQQPSLI